MQPLFEFAALGPSLQGWADIAQLVLAGAAVLALVGAYVQIRVMRGVHKRQLSYEYVRMVRSNDVLKLTKNYRTFWKTKKWADYSALTGPEQADLLVFPNLIEELAGQYNRKRIDREVIALSIGPLIEEGWAGTQEFIKGAQVTRSRWAYCEWQEMQLDTVARRRRAHTRIQRRRSRKNLFFGTGE